MFIPDKNDFTRHEDMIELCDSLFMRIRERFGSEYDKPVSVLGENNALLFNVIWESEYYYLTTRSGTRRKELQCNFDGQDLTENTDLLDLHFVEEQNEFCFDSINEYSWHITRLINFLYPGKRVFFSDENVRFFHDIKYSEYHEKRAGAPLFLTGHYLPEEKNVFSIYSLMLSLTWLYTRHYNDTREDDRTALVIDFSNLHMGFGDIIKTCSAYVSVAQSHNWIPIICLDHPTQYSDYDGEDCWSKFFVPISSITRKDLDKYKCWISVFENRNIETTSFFFPNPYIYLYRYISEQKTSFPILLNRKTLAYAKKKTPLQLLKGERTAGIIVRTTDYDFLANHSTDRNSVIETVKTILSELSYSHVFLATEDKSILDLFLETFGDRLLYVDQKRVLPVHESGSSWLSDSFSEVYKSKYEQGADYISVLYALTGCRLIILNRAAGAMYLARNLKTRITDELPVCYFFSDLFIASKAAKNNTSVILYGAGTNGRYFLMSDISRSCTVKCFCDRKAEHGEYEFEGCRVISPETLKMEYNGELVVITPTFGTDKIESMLKGYGIPQDRIILSSYY